MGCLILRRCLSLFSLFYCSAVSTSSFSISVLHLFFNLSHHSLHSASSFWTLILSQLLSFSFCLSHSHFFFCFLYDVSMHNSPSSPSAFPPPFSPCFSHTLRHQLPFRWPLFSFSHAVYYFCDSSQTPHSRRDIISSWYELSLLAL